MVSETGKRDHRLGVAVSRSGGGEAVVRRRVRGDLVADGFKVADVVAWLAVRADVCVVEVGAEVMETGLGSGQQVPDDGQYGVADCNDGPLSYRGAGRCVAAARPARRGDR
jgi:hypothetical protein